MSPASDREVYCPRCRYNLRGLPLPRCPECGLTFNEEQWRSGVLREHIPTWLDRCDPWQPHQVLIRSLYELIRGVLRPRWLLTKLDLHGPLLPAGLMLAFGTFWVCVLFTALVMVATILHTDASPYAALKSAALWWSPPAFLIGVFLAVLNLLLLVLPADIDMVKLTRRETIRFAGYWLPVATAFFVLPLGVALVVRPDFLFWLPLVLLLVLIVLPAKKQRPRIRLVSIVVGLPVFVLVEILINRARGLDPPWWVYF